mgnify:CR=1 FL=1
MIHVPLPIDERDTLIWCVSPDGKFNLKHTWGHFNTGHSRVPWCNLVWKAGGPPRHAFVFWLAVQNKLSTHDRIHKFTRGPLACVLCYRAMEDHSHLFFECNYTSFLWQDMLGRLGCRCSATNWPDVVQWAAAAWKGKKPDQIIPRMSIYTNLGVQHMSREECTNF